MNWIFLILGGGLVLGGTNVSLKLATVKGIGLWPIALYFILAGLGVGAYAWLKTPDGVAANLASPQGLQWAILAAVIGTIANLMLFVGLVTAPAGVGYTLFNIVCALSTVALSVVFLGEQLTLTQITGIALGMGGVALLSWK